MGSCGSREKYGLILTAALHWISYTCILVSYNRLGKSKGKELSCDDGHYRDRTLQLAYELPFAALFKDNKGQSKYEASSVIVVSL